MGISKATLYNYLRHQQVGIGPYHTKANLEPKTKVMKIHLRLNVERNSKFVRGIKRTREGIERYVLSDYSMKKLGKDTDEYELTIPFQTDEQLDKIVYDILQEASRIADMRHCFVEGGAHSVDDPDRQW